MAATILAAIAFTAGCGSDDNKSQTSQSELSGSISYVSYGGKTQEAMTEFWTDPFSKETGVAVSQDGPTDPAKLQAQVESGNVSWNVVHIDAFFVQANCGTLFERRPKSVDMSGLDPSTVTNPCGVPILRYTYMYAYDSDRFKSDPPTSWEDFFDTTQYPGKRAIWNYAGSGILEAALLADGVSPDQLYPLDLDRAFKKLESIKNDLVFTDPTGGFAKMESREVAFGMLPNARLYAAAETGAPYEPVWNDAISAWDNAAVPKGAPNQAASFALMNKLATPEYQNALLEPLTLGGVSTEPPPKLGPLQEKFSPVNPENMAQTVPIDQEYWAKNFATANERWTAFSTE